MLHTSKQVFLGYKLKCTFRNDTCSTVYTHRIVALFIPVPFLNYSSNEFGKYEYSINKIIESSHIFKKANNLAHLWLGLLFYKPATYLSVICTVTMY